MSLLSTFCTNSINILAGINGIETSQTLVIASSIALNDLLYLPLPFAFDFRSLHIGGIYGAGMAWGSKEMVDRHLLSLYFMLPLIGVCVGLLFHNWCALFRYLMHTFTLKSLFLGTLPKRSPAIHSATSPE